MYTRFYCSWKCLERTRWNMFYNIKKVVLFLKLVTLLLLVWNYENIIMIITLIWVNWISWYMNTIIVIKLLLMKNLSMLINLFRLKNLNRVIKLLNSNLVIESGLLNIKIFWAKITLKNNKNKYLWLILF